MPRRAVPEEEKRLVWERIKGAAQKHHKHYDEHGIVSLVARDAGVTPQSAHGWKDAKTKPTMKALSKLSARYGVSLKYLEGAADDPAQTAPPDEADLRAKMVALVEEALIITAVPDDRNMVLSLCDLALQLLQSGKDDNAVLVELTRKARAMSSENHSQDH
ncbi:helix-turn-helix transcriptional regulator [Halomonas daqingensis]|uniref:Helix-turn-helix transcriptional regulator n=1 Tax=Billgrantia desiderata TaxID=52021 RepID=A0ABS9B4C0_9GAMM|nr:helix-turn-helix transcriptional regulator [Halomonas desiderata]MCE8042469.1 helix-turn-helix transcriptional regulator [Halomonas desiderata]MCE8047044.1 helix-turn-helix transcriptional regulator [Halomonas desiderata]